MERGRRRRGWGSTALLAATLLAAPLAAPPGARAAGFDDLAAYGWAAPGIVTLQGEGAITGASSGTFDPGGLLTRAETAAVLGRMLGWPAGPAGAPLPFTDAAAIPAYAAPYVALAASRGIMLGLPGGAFAPQGSLTWPELATIAARALNGAPVPADGVAALLSQLPQGPSTPQWAQQAVAEAVQAGDFTGVLADLYQPQQAVTRAELAAFLAQAQPGASVLSGQLTAFGGQQATVQTATGSQQIAVSSGAAVYDGAMPGSLGDLQVGDSVILAGSGGVATAVDITTGPTVSQPVGLTAGVAGTLAFATGTELGVDLTGVGTVDVPAASGAILTLAGGQAGGLGDLAAGEAVALTLNAAGQAVAVGAAGSGSTTSMTGTVVSLAGNSLVLDISGTDEMFSLSADLAATAGLTPGAQVTLTVALPAAEVTAIAVDAPAAGSSATGTITAVSGDTLVLDTAGTSQTYALAPSATVNGLAGDLGVLAAGQTVTLTVSGGQVTAVATGAATAVTGNVASVAGDTLVVDVAGTNQVYTLSGATTVNGVSDNLGALAVGASVTLTLAGNQVTDAEVGGAPSSTSATGVVESLAGNNLVLDIAGSAQVFSVTPATTVDGLAGDLSLLVPGTTVTLTLSSGTVTAVQVEPTSGTTVTGQVLSLAGETLDLDVSGTGQAYTVTAATTVNGRLNDLGALFIGETVTVTVSGTAVSAILTSNAGSVTGSVVSVSGTTLEVDVAGTYDTYTLTGSTTVDGALDNASAQAAGQTVTVYGSGGNATAIQITSATGGSGAVGLVQSVAADSLVVDVAGVSQAYTLTASTTVDGSLSDLSALVAGQTVSLSAVGGQVTAVRILSADGSYSVTGVVASAAGYVVVVEVGGVDQTFALTSATTVDGLANNASAIAAGDTVTVTLAGGQVTAVQIG